MPPRETPRPPGSPRRAPGDPMTSLHPPPSGHGQSVLTNGTGDTSAGVGLAVTLSAVGDVPVPPKKPRHGCDPEPRTTRPAALRAKGSRRSLSRDFRGGARSTRADRPATSMQLYWLPAAATDTSCAHAPSSGLA